MRYDTLVVGAGLSGATAARRLAEAGRNVLVLERRAHIGGNAYDEKDASGVLVHSYGPHIFHTSDETVFAFLSRFTAWTLFTHRVLASVHGRLMPVPFNFTSLAIAFGDEAASLRARLVAEYGEGARVSVLTLRQSADAKLRELGEYVFANIFAVYSAKQWGAPPDTLGDAVLGRVPVLLSEADAYFADPWQGVPEGGFTKLVREMLSHGRVTVELGADAVRRLRVLPGSLVLDGERFEGDVLYTGALDELFGWRYGRLPYRTLDLRFETLPVDSFQPASVVNYTTDEAFTRITEFKKLTGQKLPGVTSVAREYSRAMQPGDEAYYPIPNAENARLYAEYRALADAHERFYPLGRLAEYRYANMDEVVRSALTLTNRLAKERP